MLINTVLLEINWNCGKFLWIELKYLHTPPPPLTIQCPASTGFMLSNNMCNQNAVCFCNRHILLLYNRWQKMKLIFSICICNGCLCTMNLYNVTARQNDRPFVLQGPGWHNVFWRPIWKIIFMYRMRRISIIRITELLIHAEILGFVWFLPISDVFYFLPLKFSPDFPCHFSIFAHICWFQAVFIPENIKHFSKVYLYPRLVKDTAPSNL